MGALLCSYHGASGGRTTWLKVVAIPRNSGQASQAGSVVSHAGAS